MYQYDQFDQAVVDQRVAQFRDQTQRRLAGELSEAEFKPLRLRNGLYLQLHAYMLRIAVPYGLLSTRQMRMLAHIARRYDKGYGHFTTRQNIQFNWLKLEEAPDLLADLASVEMHGIQTSGNCIRNITSDPYAGVAADEIEDPRPYCEIMRQWSTFHPEFSFLPRKFKIAVSAAEHDRTVLRMHDIGLRMVQNGHGETGFEVHVGGGMGRTPMIGKVIREFVPKKHLLSYLEAIMRIYNEQGRRDNLFKARIKILVHALGIDKFRELVDAEWEKTKNTGLLLDDAEIARVTQHFDPPDYEELADDDPEVELKLATDHAFADWFRHNVVPHKVPGYSIAVASLKALDVPPGDATHEQMDALADLADRYSLGRIRVTYEQNLVLADVKTADLDAVWTELQRIGFATPNINKLTDIICCPGLDFCGLANARSIPVSQRISQAFADLDRLYDLGDIRVNISGCINACGHHHAGNIGILGVDKKGEEFYQVTLGGSPKDDASIGKIIGPAFSSEEIVDAIEKVVDVYVEQRSNGEAFLQTYRRVGEAPFKERLYVEH